MALVRELQQDYGPYTPLSVAWRWLSFPSLDAARRAHQRGLTPIPMHRLGHRRGLFVLSEDLGRWLADQGIQSMLTPATDIARRAQPMS